MEFKEALAGERRNQSTIKEVLQLAHELQQFTADPGPVLSYFRTEKESEGEKFWEAVDQLIDAILFLPRRSGGLRAMLARTKAEDVRLACEVCKILFDQTENVKEVELRMAILKIDVAIVQFQVVAL